MNNHLIEVDYASDDSATITDDSDDLGIGPIAGTPAIADVRNDIGAENRISVAVVKAGTNELYTLDDYSSRWHVRPILLAGGGTATGMGTVFATSYGPSEFGYTRSYIAMQLNLGAHMIYTRSSWTQSYTQFAWQTNRPPGVVSIGGHSSDCRDGCALSRDAATNRPMWAPLTNGGDITSLLKPMDPTPLAHEVTLGGSMFATPQPISTRQQRTLGRAQGPRGRYLRPRGHRPQERARPRRQRCPVRRRPESSALLQQPARHPVHRRSGSQCARALSSYRTATRFHYSKIGYLRNTISASQTSFGRVLES